MRRPPCRSPRWDPVSAGIYQAGPRVKRHVSFVPGWPTAVMLRSVATCTVLSTAVPVWRPLPREPAGVPSRGAIRGESVRGGLAPLSQEDSAKSELAEVRRRRAREFRFPARSAGRIREGASFLALVALPGDIPATAPSWVRMVRGAEHRACRSGRGAIRGESVRGGLAPLSQEDSAKSELAEVRRRRAREFRFPARSAGRIREGASFLALVALTGDIPATAPSRVRMVRGAEHRGAGLETGVPGRRAAGERRDGRGAEHRGAGLETGVPYGQRPLVDFLRMRPLLFMRPTVFPTRMSFAFSMSASFAQAM